MYDDDEPPAATAGLMTSQQVCEYLGISDNTLRRWCAAGLPYIQPHGMRKRFRKSDVDAYLAGSVTVEDSYLYEGRH